MSDVEHFAVLVLVVGAAIIAAVLLNRVSERIRIPAPAIFLVAAAVASDLVPSLGQLSVTTVQRVISVALAVIRPGPGSSPVACTTPTLPPWYTWPTVRW